MYRLVLLGLFAVVGWSLVLSLTGSLSYSVWSLIASFFLITVLGYTTNELFGKILKLPLNPESSSITCLILFCILPPVTTWQEAGFSAIAVLAAMASKYLLVWRGKHVFNPAAFGAFVMPLLFGVGAIWWVASPAMLFVTLPLGLLVVRKIHRFVMLGVFALTAFLAITYVQSAVSLWEIVASWPIVFFGTIMLTEPLTAPATQRLQMVYAGIAGVLFGSSFHLGPIYASPEFALLAANLFSVFVNPTPRLIVRLKERSMVAKDIYHLSFETPTPLLFSPGQYMEWTVLHEAPDNRGVRRYFTVASAPGEKVISIGVKIAEKSSSFKQALLKLVPGDRIAVAQLAGDFTLPKDAAQKLVFIAGGIGITPFRSMAQHCITRGEKRDAVLFYAANTESDFAYKPLFEKAREAGLKTVYLPKDTTGYLTPERIKEEVPDFSERTFYISGPNAMVHSYKEMLAKLGVSTRNIVTDYFPGF